LSSALQLAIGLNYRMKEICYLHKSVVSIDHLITSENANNIAVYTFS